MASNLIRAWVIIGWGILAWHWIFPVRKIPVAILTSDVTVISNPSYFSGGLCRANAVTLDGKDTELILSSADYNLGMIGDTVYK